MTLRPLRAARRRAYNAGYMQAHADIAADLRAYARLDYDAPGSARRRSALNQAAQRLEMRLAAARRSSQSPTTGGQR